MAIKCSGCGNFISLETSSCPICGDAKDFDSSRHRVGTQPPHGPMNDIWDNFWQIGEKGFAMSRKEALLLKVLVAILMIILAVTAFSAP